MNPRRGRSRGAWQDNETDCVHVTPLGYVDFDGTLAKLDGDTEKLSSGYVLGSSLPQLSVEFLTACRVIQSMVFLGVDAPLVLYVHEKFAVTRSL